MMTRCGEATRAYQSTKAGWTRRTGDCKCDKPGRRRTCWPGVDDGCGGGAGVVERLRPAGMTDVFYFSVSVDFYYFTYYRNMIHV